MIKNIVVFILICLLPFGLLLFSCQKKTAQEAKPEQTGLSQPPIVRVTQPPVAKQNNLTKPPIIREKPVLPGTGPDAPVAENVTRLTQQAEANLTTSDNSAVKQPFTLEKPAVQSKKIILDKAGNNYPFINLKTEILAPIDYKIGMLQNQIEGELDQIQIISQLNLFLNALTKGRIKKELLASKAAASISGYLDYQITKKKTIPEKFRIGETRVKNSESRINIRLFSETGSTEGEIYLIKQEGTWYITDFQINLELLNVESVKDPEPFMPSDYYWMLQEKL